jgi:uncharacterized protein YkwD
MKVSLNRFLILLAFVCCFSFSNAQSPELREALIYLNKVRAQPARFSGEIGVGLDDVLPLHALRWDSNLAAAAQYKARDMATRNYFDHVDPDGYGMNHYILKFGYALNPLWLDKKANNFFESIAAGQATPKAAIAGLINDGGEQLHENAGHRLHLLGIKDFWKPCYDIGIGWAYNEHSFYKYFCCVLIAKHDWGK